MATDRKQCAVCRRWYRIDVRLDRHGPFYSHCSKVDGLQPQCRRCDRDLPRYIHRRWTRLVAVLKAEGIEHMWTRRSYEDFLITRWEHGMPVAECYWCGGNALEWAGGHCVDRASSDGVHEPNNSLVCCFPCNITKGDKNFNAWKLAVAEIVRRYGGRGRVQWQDESKRFRRYRPVDLSAYECEPPPPPLGPLFEHYRIEVDV